MLRYLFRRILSMIPLLIVVTAFTFVVGQYGAGDLAAYLAGTRGDPTKGIDVELYKQFRQELGMDDPILSGTAGGSGTPCTGTSAGRTS